MALTIQMLMRAAYVSVGLATLATAKPVSKRSTEAGDFTHDYGSAVSLHCFEDNDSNPPTTHRLLPVPVSIPAVTPKLCAEACAKKLFIYSGVEYGGECWCGNTIELNRQRPSAAECNMPCSASTGITCGGSWLINVYKSTLNVGNFPDGDISPNADASTKITTTYKGCYDDNISNRAFSKQVSILNLTPDKCAYKCAKWNMPYSGVEWSSECFCSLTAPTTTLRTDGSCNMACAGDANMWCGGSLRLSVYQSTLNPAIVDLSDINGPVPTPPSGTSELASYALNGKQYTNLGCYHDPAETGAARLLPDFADISDLTIQKCLAACLAKDAKYAGIQYSSECWCGNSLASNESLGHNNAKCNMAAKGSSTQLAGGSWAANVYSITNAVSGIAPYYTFGDSDQGITGVSYLGCYTETSPPPRFPHQVLTSQGANMNIYNCVTACSNDGYEFAGLEGASQCFCTHTQPSSAAIASNSDSCNLPCPGAGKNGIPYQTCGGSSVLSVYMMEGVSI